jgi:hypothetical protein
MISVSDILQFPCGRDLIHGGIAYALHSLPYQFHRAGSLPYERLRRAVAGAAIELAFRRYLSEQEIPFEVKSALPFTERERYDVTLGRQRCEIKSFLISHSDQIAEIQQNPQVLLKAPALVASDQHAGDAHSQHDLYLFAFLSGLVTASQADILKVVKAKQPYYLIHAMPEAWSRPSTWSPLGKLVLKSEVEERIIVELGGQDAGREICSYTVELPPRTRIEIQNEFFSLLHVHVKSVPAARIGIHSPVGKLTHTVRPEDWENLWIYGREIWLAGYSTREEFSRRARFVPAGSHVFQYHHTQVKNLAVPVSELRPLSELFERVKLEMR